MQEPSRTGRVTVAAWAGVQECSTLKLAKHVGESPTARHIVTVAPLISNLDRSLLDRSVEGRQGTVRLAAASVAWCWHVRGSSARRDGEVEGAFQSCKES